jgi:hypothetical protein
LSIDFVCQIEHIYTIKRACQYEISYLSIYVHIYIYRKEKFFFFFFCFFISMSVICKLHFERIDRRTNLFEAVERVYLRECVIWFKMIVAALLITCDTFSMIRSIKILIQSLLLRKHIREIERERESLI